MKLNMACGPTRWPGFDNSDIHGEPGTSIVDLEDRPLPYDDGSAELILHSHGLLMTKDGTEPTHPDLPALFAEWHRILKPGGWLRLDDNPLRFYDESTMGLDEQAGFPQDQRLARVDLAVMLEEAGFRNIGEVRPDTTLIPADPETHQAIVGNHAGHVSFAVEARK